MLYSWKCPFGFTDKSTTMGFFCLLSVVITLLLSGSFALDSCKGWKKFGNDCYLLQYAPRVSFYDAEDFCRSQGAHLASIHTEEENDFLLQASSKGGYRDRMWIGLNILDGKDSPKWSDNSPVDYQKRIHKDFYTNEKCFILMRSNGGWRPEHCALHYVPICKRSINATPTAIPPPTTVLPLSGNCPKDWLKFGEKCLKYFGSEEVDQLEYKKARDACWALGTNHDLVSIHSEEEQAFITQHLYSLGTSAWIGMREITSDEVGHDIVFGWIDNSKTDYIHWATGHPPRGTWKYCARLRYMGVAKGEWLADYCNPVKQGYICQRPTDPALPNPPTPQSPCDARSTEFRNSCYRLVTEPATQVKAEEVCQGSGGHLVSIFDGFEQAFLSNFNTLGQVWTGLKSSQGTPYFQWSDKSPVYYSNWGNGEPIFNTEPSCVVLDSNNNFKWNTRKCNEKLPFICETTTENPPKFPEILGSCPSSSIDIGDKNCYHFAEPLNHLMSWNDASRYCLTARMQMVESYSDHQMLSLAARLWTESSSVHLGLARTNDKKSFVWLDGSPLNYTNWDTREPSSYPGEKNCVTFDQSTAKWKTISCNDAGVVLCQDRKKL